MPFLLSYIYIPFSFALHCVTVGLYFLKKRPVFYVKSRSGPGPVQVLWGLVWPGSARDSAPAEVEAAYRSARRTAR